MNNSVTTPLLGHAVLVRIETHVRSIRDRRVFVDCHVYAYFDADGNEYRKSFEVRTGRIPQVPVAGTSRELTAQRFQWYRQ